MPRFPLAKRAAAKRGWQTTKCLQYGKTVSKKYKTFLATYRPACGVIRVEIVQEPTGPQFFFDTDPEATVKEILETLADRAAIEQYFHDLKEVWGAGQLQVRCPWTNIGAYHLNLWMHTLVWNCGLGGDGTVRFATAALRHGTIPGDALRTPIAATPCAATSSMPNFWQLPVPDACREKFATSSNNCSALQVNMIIF